MRVVIDSLVVPKLKEFYAQAMKQYITLTEETVLAKIDRLLDAVQSLGDFPRKYPFARYKSEWISKGYHDFTYEDIHFAYKVVLLDTGEEVVYVADVCHSLFYHD